MHKYTQHFNILGQKPPFWHLKDVKTVQYEKK